MCPKLFARSFIRLVISSVLTAHLITPISQATQIRPKLVGGFPVDVSLFPEVIQVKSEGQVCTATVVGPRVLLMAAHCISAKNPLVEFTMERRNYKAMGIQSPLYGNQGHDLALAIVFDSTVPIHPASIGGVAQMGREILYLGYGPATPDCNNQGDARLRSGDSVIAQLTSLELVSNPEGVTFCKEDGGSPAFMYAEPEPVVVGVGSRTDTSSRARFARTDSSQARSFFNDTAHAFNISICGVTEDCY